MEKTKINLYSENLPILFRKYKFKIYTSNPDVRVIKVKKLKCTIVNPSNFYKRISKI